MFGVFRKNFIGLLNGLTFKKAPLEKESGENNISQDNLLKLVDEARYSWQAARSIFNNVTEPDLIDHAIYNLNAAERRYMYLWKKARQTGCEIRGSGHKDML